MNILLRQAVGTGQLLEQAAVSSPTRTRTGRSHTAVKNRITGLRPGPQPTPQADAPTRCRHRSPCCARTYLAEAFSPTRSRGRA